MTTRDLLGLVASFAVAVAAAATFPIDSAASACAFAFGAGGAPRTEGEEALIVWEPDAQREHFVRTARFAGVSGSFAFLVPTPGRPELAEADDGVFARLARFYLRPPPVLRSRPRSLPNGPQTSAVEPPVTVVEQTRVAGLDATVLAATDTMALTAWLREHGYATRPDLDAWLAPYVSRSYFVTAFRYDPATQTEITSRAVRLSFATDRPFYPYAEPQGALASEGRTLRLSVVAPFRIAGREGDAPWSARVGYAGRPRGLGAALAGTLPARASAGPWITTFDDVRARRGNADVFFERAADQTVVAASIDPMVLGGPH